MDFIGVLLNISIIISGVVMLVTGEVYLTKKSKPLRNKIIARIVGVLFTLSGLVFLVNDFELGRKIRSWARHDFHGKDIEHSLYLIGDFIDHQAVNIAIIAIIVGILVVVFAPKKKDGYETTSPATKN